MRSAADDHGPGLSRLSVPRRGDPLGGALVPAVPDQLPRPRAHARRSRGRGRPHHHVPLGPALRPRAREAYAPASPACRGPWHVDETYIQVDGASRYLYRAVDGTGQTIDFLLSAKRDKQAAKRFFRKALGRDNTRNPRTIVTDRLKSYPGALREMKREGELWRFTRHRRGRWLNNLVEQDHRRIKRRTGPMPARLSELWDRSANPRRRRGHGDAGQGTGGCHVGQRHAGAAGPRPPGVRPRRLSEGERAGARLRSANATVLHRDHPSATRTDLVLGVPPASLRNFTVAASFSG